MRNSGASPYSRRGLDRRLLGPIVAILVLVGCSGGGQGGQSGQSGQGGGQQQQPPVQVDAKTVIPHTVEVMAEYPGRVEGRRTVEVRARVEGILERRYYEEGAIVERGDPLFLIDPAPFQAVVNQREAELASARARLNEAQRTWRRVQRLYELDAVSEAERDQALSALETSQAAVQQAQANLEAAQIDLDYTDVRAEITGVTTLREVDEGALVSSGTHLTTITQLDPVRVLFSLPEDDALARRKALSVMGDESNDARTREATIILPTGEVFPEAGRVDFTQSTVDPQTGTVQLRAVVANPDNELMPGRFVRARIRLDTRHNAVVVPNAAISDGQQLTQVYIVNESGQAKSVKVELGPEVKEGVIVESGLSGGEQVIISGLAQVSEGRAVQIKEGASTRDLSGRSNTGGQTGGGSGNSQSPSSGQGASNSGESSAGSSGESAARRQRDTRAVALTLRMSDPTGLVPLDTEAPSSSGTAGRPTPDYERDGYAARIGQGS